MRFTLFWKHKSHNTVILKLTNCQTVSKLLYAVVGVFTHLMPLIP